MYGLYVDYELKENEGEEMEDAKIKFQDLLCD